MKSRWPYYCTCTPEISNSLLLFFKSTLNVLCFVIYSMVAMATQTQQQILIMFSCCPNQLCVDIFTWEFPYHGSFILVYTKQNITSITMYTIMNVMMILCQLNKNHQLAMQCVPQNKLSLYRLISTFKYYSFMREKLSLFAMSHFTKSFYLFRLYDKN